MKGANLVNGCVDGICSDVSSIGVPVAPAACLNRMSIIDASAVDKFLYKSYAHREVEVEYEVFFSTESKTIMV